MSVRWIDAAGLVSAPFPRALHRGQMFGAPTTVATVPYIVSFHSRVPFLPFVTVTDREEAIKGADAAGSETRGAAGWDE